MTTAFQALAAFLPFLYLATAFACAMHFGGPGAPRVVGLRRGLKLLSVTGGLALLLVRWRAFDGFPIFDTWSTLSAVAVALVVLYIVSAPRGAAPGVGVVVFLVATGMQVLANAFGPPHAGGPLPFSNSFYLLHALTSVAAAGALALSGIEGALYLLVFRQMRQRRFGPLVQRMPSLDALAVHTRRAALSGFLLLAVGVNVGIGWAHAAGVEEFHYSDPWVMAMIVLWMHFGIVAFSRRIPGLSARRASIAAAAGLTVFLAFSLLALVPSFTFHSGA